MKTKYLVNKKIDYLTVTLQKAPHDIIGDIDTKLDYSPLKNYNMAYRTKTGAIVCYHTQREEMKTHVIMSGECLEYIRGEGHTDIDLAEYFLNTVKAKIGRVDICVTSVRKDNKPHNLDPHYLAILAKRGELKSNLKHDNGVIDAGMYIETTYIGSRLARNRLFKAYDKGIDLGETAKRIIRYELETRKRANLVLNAVREGHDIGGIIRRYVDFPNVALWVEIMQAEPSIIPQIEDNRDKRTKDAIERANRWHWMLTSVAPAMAKAVYEDMQQDLSVPEDILNSENMRLFMIRVFQKIDELAQKDLDDE